MDDKKLTPKQIEKLNKMGFVDSCVSPHKDKHFCVSQMPIYDTQHRAKHDRYYSYEDVAEYFGLWDELENEALSDKEKLETATECLNDISKILNDQNSLETKVTDIGLVLGFWRASISDKPKQPLKEQVKETRLIVIPTYKIEFPDYELDFDLPEGFADHSWHNDICPKFYNEEKDLTLWADYSNPEDRESQGNAPRFLLIHHEGEDNELQLIHTEDYQELLDCINTFDDADSDPSMYVR